MHALLTAATLAAALSAAPGDPAAGAPRETPPPPGPPRSFALPELRRFTLENGLGVTLVEVGNMPKVSVELALRSGTGDEGPAEIGLAQLVATMLLEGTTTRSATEIAALAARWGGSVEASVTPDLTLIGGTALSEFAPDLVALVADVATNPAFPEKELERVRNDRVREITIARTVPQTLAQERFLALTYPGHGYGRLLPAPEQVKGYGRGDVERHHRATFGASRARLYVAGRFDARRVEGAIREAFARWAAGAPREVAAARPASKREVHLVERPGAVQSTLWVGLPALDPRHPDYVKLVVTNTLLGGYFSSRMVANLREAKGYTYSPRSVLAVRGDAPGYWVQVADVTTAVTGASLKEVFGEIERLRAEPPSAQELATAQAFMAGAFVLEASDREGLLERLRFVDLHGLPQDWLERYVPAVKAVTPADVQAMARTWLDAARMTVVVVGDRQQVEEQVKPFGNVIGAGPPRS